MKKSRRLIFVISLLLCGFTNVYKQEHIEMDKQKESAVSEETDRTINKILEISIWDDIQTDQYLIKPLEEYPFDCDVLYSVNQLYNRC